jgi:hypothetical protein
MKKILIACPTADIKDYCFDEWLSNVNNFTYSNFEIMVCDNSQERDYYIDLKNRYKNQDNIFFHRVTPSQFNLSYKHILAKSHDRCRLYALENNFDYLLHLESDVFPPINVIERLLDAQKKIVGAMYFIEQGEQSKLMVQQIEDWGIDHRETFNLEENDILLVDGELKKVFSCGLGCVLIDKSILKEVPFRYEEGASVHPDSFFYADLDLKNIPVYLDTSILCEHKNQSLKRI